MPISENFDYRKTQVFAPC